VTSYFSVASSGRNSGVLIPMKIGGGPRRNRGGVSGAESDLLSCKAFAHNLPA
jgi:hypothetical protein